MVTFFVCIGAVGSTVIYSQVWWNFRIYYLLPLVLYFVLLFFIRSRARYLWLAGIVSVVWLIGNLPYFVVIWGLSLLVFTVALSIRHWKSWRSFVSMSRVDWIALGTFLVVATVFVAFAWYAVHDIEILQANRDPTTQATSLDTFLTYGGPVD